VDVVEKPEELQKMLEMSGGKRRVPVIVQGENVTIGHNGS